jgi:hypothetical protein
MRLRPRTLKIFSMSAVPAGPRLCRLEQAVGVDAACPEDACPFWEPGGAVLAGRCAVEGIDFSRDPGVATWLLAIRKRLEESVTPGEDVSHELRRLLNASGD